MLDLEPSVIPVWLILYLHVFLMKSSHYLPYLVLQGFNLPVYNVSVNPVVNPSRAGAPDLQHHICTHPT
jgi:hypothetical protein